MDSTNSVFNKKSIAAISSGAAAIVAVVAVMMILPAIDAPDNMTNPTLDIDVSTSEESDAPVKQDKENPIVAAVNGEPIMFDDIQTQKNLQGSAAQDMDSAAILDQLVVRELLLQEAESRDISTTEDEAESALEQQILQSGMTNEQFKATMSQQGLTYSQVVDVFQEQLTIDALLQDEIGSNNIQVSDQESMLFFEENIKMIQDQMGADVKYDDISAQIKTTIMQQKQQELVSDFIAELESIATIIFYKDKL